MNFQWHIFFLPILLMVLCTGCPDKTDTKSSEGTKNTSTEKNKPAEKPDLPPLLPTETTEETAPLWQKVDKQHLPEGEKRVKPNEYVLFKTTQDFLLNLLEGDKIEIELPFEDQVMVFYLENAGTMSPGLAAKFPNIKSYKGTSGDGTVSVRADHNEDGFYVEYTSPHGKFYLSPILKGNLDFYVLYPEETLAPGPRGTR